MRSILAPGRSAGLFLGVVWATLTLAPPSFAQPARPAAPPGVQRMEIYQGANRTIEYVPHGPLSLDDRLAARDLQRAENEMDYVDNLQRLKHLYIKSELAMEPRRLYAQEQLYGLNINVYSYASGGYFGGGGGGGYTYPYAWNGNRYGYGGYGGYGGGLGGAVGGSGWSTNSSLANGMGYEGITKSTLIQSVIPRETTPEYAASVAKGFRDAVTTAARSEVLRNSLGLGQSAIPPNPERTVSYPKGDTLFILRCLPPIAGVVVREDANWVVVRTLLSEVTVARNRILSYQPIPQPAPAPKTMKPVSE